MTNPDPPGLVSDLIPPVTKTLRLQLCSAFSEMKESILKGTSSWLCDQRLCGFSLFAFYFPSMLACASLSTMK